MPKDYLKSGRFASRAKGDATMARKNSVPRGSGPSSPVPRRRRGENLDDLLDRVIGEAQDRSRAWTAKHSPPILHRSITKIRVNTVYSTD